MTTSAFATRRQSQRRDRNTYGNATRGVLMATRLFQAATFEWREPKRRHRDRDISHTAKYGRAATAKR